MAIANRTAAAAYIRMSSDKQEASPEQQRREIEAYAAKHGYEIVIWYEDLGISGDKTEKRFEFQRMIADGSTGKFRVIICWDQDRFGRFDSLEAGHWIYPLRQAGVSLDTVKDGPTDWEDMTGRLMYGIKQEGKHAYLTDLSANIHRAHKQKKDEGKWTTGLPPFGYDIDENRKLIPGDRQRVNAVKEMFRQYASGYSLREIAGYLNGSGIRTQKNKDWTAKSVSLVLANERYLGHMIYDQRSTSKYRDPNNRQGKTILKDRSEWTIVKDTHEALVDLETWRKVQQRRDKNQKLFSGPKSKNRYALTGILYCGHCGGRMGSHTNRSGRRDYQCVGYHAAKGTCERRSVDEKTVLREALRCVREQIFDQLFGPSEIDQIKQQMRELLLASSEDRSAAVRRNRARLSEVNGDLKQAAEALVRTSEDLRSLVEDRIRELQYERDALTDKLSEDDAPGTEQLARAEQRIEAAVRWLDRIEALVDTDYDAGEVSRMLSQFVTRIDVDVERELLRGGNGKREQYQQKLVGGRVYFSTENFPSWAIPSAAHNLCTSSA